VPTQAIAVDENYTAQNALIIHTRLAVGLWEKGSSVAISVSLSQKRSLMSLLQLRSREARSTPEINAS